MDLYALTGPLVRTLPAERAHTIAVWALEHGLLGRRAAVIDPRLQVDLAGLHFANPVGLAAGFDKDARVFDAMLDQGFGHVEVGSITPQAQPGNPKPRVFRIPSARAVINRLGFNNQGAEAARVRLTQRKRSHGVVGVNLGKNKSSDDAVSDYRIGAEVLGPVADYLVVNVSSPNTPGLRDLQRRSALEAIVEAVRRAAPEVPLFLKIAPDLSDEDLSDVVEFARSGVDALIVSNTTITRPDGLPDGVAQESGGLSGGPLFELSTRVLRDVFRKCGDALPLIGVGGITTPEQGYEKILAGARLVQLYTGLIYSGTRLVRDINESILRGLERDGFQHLHEAVGKGA